MNATFLCFSPCFAENKHLPKKKAVDFLRRGRLACRNIFFLTYIFSFTFTLPSTNCVGGKQYKTNHQHLDGYEGRQQNGIRMSLCAHGKRNDSPAFAFNLYLSPSIYLFVTLYMGQFASFNVFISLSDVSNVLCSLISSNRVFFMEPL